MRGPLSALVVLVIAHERFFQLEIVQQLQRHARILRGDEVRLRQRLAAADGDVAEIADRRGHEIEHSGHGQSS